MNLEIILGIIQIILIATTPLVFAGIGELVTEKTGVLNLGVEGMMLIGAVTAFVTLVITGSYFLAFLVSILSGALMSGLFAYLVLILMSNQVATGLALTIFGIGLIPFSNTRTFFFLCPTSLMALFFSDIEHANTLLLNLENNCSSVRYIFCFKTLSVFKKE